MKKVSVLFVCLGNICRSPLGAALLKHKIRQNGMDAWVEVDSCGTSNYHIGDNADPRTLATASRNGVSMDHCVRQLTTEDLNDFDFIFAMDKSNYQNIVRLTVGEKARKKVRLIREFDPEKTGEEVPDPYHGGDKDFQEVYDILDRSTTNLISYLEKTDQN